MHDAIWHHWWLKGLVKTGVHLLSWPEKKLHGTCHKLNILWGWHTSLAGLSNMHHTVTLLSVCVHSFQQSNAYF